MARMPGAKWQPLAANWASQPKLKTYDLICIHTMVGGLIGTDGYFRNGNGVGYAGTESHFGTGGAGEIVQWQDTAYQAEANLNGNWHILSIENADMGPGFPKWNTADGAAVPAFTDEQCEAIAQIIAWACKEHDIPCTLVPDSKPGRRGICYHRQGVPGYMVAGGEKWSNATGKVCPGNRRIAQIPGIIKRAQEILSAKNTTTLKETFMPALNDDEQRELLTLLRRQRDVTERLLAEQMGPFDPKTGRSTEKGHDTWNESGQKLSALDMLRQVHRESTFRLLSRVPGSTYKGTVLDFAANADGSGYDAVQRLGRLEAKLDKLVAAIGGADEVTPADPS